MPINPKTAVKLAVGGVLAVTVATVALPAAGFTNAGVAADSLASSVQSAIGNVAAGSLFSSMQSAGVLGLDPSTQAGIAAAGVAVTCAAIKLMKKLK